jgi:DNA mismatch endonuclease, patch repair protein
MSVQWPERFCYNLPIDYVRDKRSPTPKSEAVSRVMSANRAQNTTPELLLRKALWSANLRGYRLHPKHIPGRPDVAFTKNKLAIFVNGCYWHRCPKCNYALPKTNTEFWQQKFTRNTERDRRKKRGLQRLGWKVIFVWECDPNRSVRRRSTCQ